MSDDAGLNTLTTAAYAAAIALGGLHDRVGELRTGLSELQAVGGDTGAVIGGIDSALTGLAHGELGAVITGLHSAAEGLAHMADEANRQDLALRALGDGMDAISRRTNDTVDETDAWRMQQRLLTTGLHATGEELAAISGFAREYALSHGTTAAEATERLTGALIRGTQNGLRPFGLAVDAAHTRSENWHVLLGQMSTSLDHNGVSARTAGEEINRFDRELGDAANGLGRTAANAIHLTGALRTLTQLVTNEGGVWGQIGRFTHAAARGIAGDFAGASREFAAMAVSPVQRPTAAPANDNGLNADGLTADQAGAIDRAIGDSDANAFGRTPRARHGGGGGGGHGRNAADALALRHIQEELRAHDELRQHAYTREKTEYLHHETEMRAERTHADQVEKAEINRDLDEKQAMFRRLESQEKAHLNHLEDLRLQDRNAMRAGWEEALHLNESSSQRMASFTTSMYHSMTGALEQHLAAVIEGNESWGEAARGAAHQLSMVLGMRAAEEAVMETAAGFGMIARAAGSYGADVGAEVSAAQHFISAGIYASIAGAGFAAAYATNAPKGGSGAGGAGGHGAPSAAASVGGSRGAANDNATVINYVNIEGSVISDREMAPYVGRGLEHLYGSRQLPGFMRTG